MTQKEMILKYSKPHECKPGETCSHYNGEAEGRIEIPSATFILATKRERELQPKYGFPPD
tara:strand:+ start:8214 stop:8393 length:180 start_codon:yes stop_codon:yes gene_type:complete